jgi:hypothetical protein
MSRKLMLDIEVGSNGGFVVTRYMNVANSLQKLVGTKTETETLAFANAKDLVEWLERFRKSEF